MQTTIKLRNGRTVDVDVYFHYDAGERPSWDSPGEPESLDVEEIRYTATGNPVRSKLAKGEWDRLYKLVEQAHEQAQWDRAEDLAADRDCDCYYDDPRADYIYDPFKGM